MLALMNYTMVGGGGRSLSIQMAHPFHIMHLTLTGALPVGEQGSSCDPH